MKRTLVPKHTLRRMEEHECPGNMNCDTLPFAVSGVEPQLRAGTKAFDSAQAERIYEADFGSKTHVAPNGGTRVPWKHELRHITVRGERSRTAAPSRHEGLRLRSGRTDL